jgi:hypothetical protein
MQSILHFMYWQGSKASSSFSAFSSAFLLSTLFMRPSVLYRPYKLTTSSPFLTDNDTELGN